MGKDVGRNDPCPCGSGQKYKRCCLRKPQHQRSSSSTTQNTWTARFKRAVESGRQARTVTDAVDAYISGWQPLREGIGDNVSTFDDAQEKFGSPPPFIRNWMWDLLDSYRGLVARQTDTERAGEAANFVAEIVDVFDGESENLRNQLLAERAFFLSKAGQLDEAESLCETLIDDHPKRTAAYCTLADIYLDAEPPRLEEALDVLQRAANEPVEDPDDWDLSTRIERIESDLEQQAHRESEHFIEWSEFWSELYEADLDTRLGMARDRIEHAPDFDDEWALHLMEQGLRSACVEHGRGQEWLDLLETLRQEHPDVANDRSGYLANSGLGFALDIAPDLVEPLVDMLFARPIQNIDMILPSIERLATQGYSDIRGHLVEGWSVIRDSGALMPGAYTDWAYWTAFAQMASWADEDIKRERSVVDLDDELGPIMEELEPTLFEDVIASFFSDSHSDPSSLIDDADTEPAARRLAFAHARHLVEERDWTPFEAIAAANYTVKFLEHCATCEDPFSDKYGTVEAGKSRAYRAKLKKLRDLWREDFE